MPLADFVRDVKDRDLTLTVVGRTDPDPVQRMLEDLFAGQSITVEEATDESVIPGVSGGRKGSSEATVESPESNLVLLRHGEETLGISSLEEVRDSMLLVNSDLYITGARDIDEIDTPEVLARLEEVPFSVEGYPASENGKLLLIEMSRHIEARAFETGAGVLHTGFQRLSRIRDERGTERVYRRLAGETDVEAHLYGVPDRVPDVAGEASSLHVHGERDSELTRTWFVVFVPPEGRGHAALVCVETGDNEWDGFWTYTPEIVEEVHGYLQQTYW